jgi:UDP-3-O-[3-hydroxymyristoyl] glucosamine N-acyltransferase
LEKRTTGWSLAEIAKILGGELFGPADLLITGPGNADSDDPHALVFAESEGYLKKLAGLRIGAVLTKPEFEGVETPSIRVPKPRESYALFLELCRRELPLEAGVHERAVVSAEASVDPDAMVGAFAVVERGATVEKGARIYPFAYVGEDCKVGEDAVIYPHAVLYRDVQVGARSVIHAGAVLGSDGFGYTWNGSRHVKIPQVGSTIIASDVEIGACTTIDRAMIGETRIGDGTKIDNQVQVGHNSHIGRHTVIASLAGISGSTIIGDRCTLAGQTATVDHIKIGDDVILTGRAAASKDLLTPGAYRGAPATPYAEELRLEAAYRRLPDLLKKVRDLERRLKELENDRPT